MLASKKPWDDLTANEVAVFTAALDRTEYAALSREIGRFMIAWSQLEQAILLLLRKVAETPDAFDLMALSGEMDVYKKCSVLLALSGRRKRPTGWHADLAALCKHIRGRFREERNRLVHDGWIITDGTISRLFYNPKQAKPGGLPTVVDKKGVTLADIQELSARVVLASLLVQKLYKQLDQ